MWDAGSRMQDMGAGRSRWDMGYRMYDGAGRIQDMGWRRWDVGCKNTGM